MLLIFLSARVMGYINKLHPQTHKNLYSIIEQVVAKAIPLWNQTLTPLKAPHHVSLRVQMKGYGYKVFDDCEDGDVSKSPAPEFDEDHEDYLNRWHD